MPSMCNAFPLLLSYKEFIFPNLASSAPYVPVKPESSAPADEIETDRIFRRISRFQLSTRDPGSYSGSHTPTRSPDLTTRHDPGSPVGKGNVRKASIRDKDYFDTMVLAGLNDDRDVIANLQAIERTEV